jgi:hypothetical protein
MAEVDRCARVLLLDVDDFVGEREGWSLGVNRSFSVHTMLGTCMESDGSWT